MLFVQDSGFGFINAGLLSFPSLDRSFVQIGAWVSDQSEPVGSRQELDEKAEGIEVRREFWR